MYFDRIAWYESLRVHQEQRFQGLLVEIDQALHQAAPQWFGFVEGAPCDSLRSQARERSFGGTKQGRDQDD